MDEPKIPGDDQFRIEQIVIEFRHRLENLYRMAYVQGRLDQVTEDRERLWAKGAA